jgi:glucose/arabinose dehydrogenase
MASRSHSKNRIRSKEKYCFGELIPLRHACRCIILVAACLCLSGASFSINAATLPAGFTETQVAGLPNPTAMELAPDGRLFVCLQTGQLRVIKNGVLLPPPFLTVNTDSNGERGLLGIAFDPNFSINKSIYVYYTVPTPVLHNRVSRFTANGDVVVPGSEFVILDLDPLSGATNHNGGAIHFGPDGKLYVAVGENANSANSQLFTNRLGKMLRINSDGTIPSDNPFLTMTSGDNRSIWAMGLRNPFTFAFQPNTLRMFINDVGQNAWEEINDGIAGSNYGWPNAEGITHDVRYRDPLFAYAHGTSNTTGCAIAGGSFYNPAAVQFPSTYVGKYFFADLCSGWIRVLDPSDNTATLFATGINQPVDLKVADDGTLYYLSRGSSAVFRVQFPSPPVLVTEGTTDRAIALDSVNMVRDPFPLDKLFDLTSEHRTRLMLFAVNAELLQGEGTSAVTAQVEDALHAVRPMTVEFVGTVPGYYWLTEVVVRLPDNLPGNGDVFVSIMLHAKTSNKARVTMQ